MNNNKESLLVPVSVLSLFAFNIIFLILIFNFVFSNFNSIKKIEQKLDNLPIYCVFNDGGEITINATSTTNGPAVNIELDKCKKFILDKK